MTVKILRRTGWIGGLLPITIELNGKKISTLKTNEETEIEVPNNDMELRVTQYGSSSNKIIIDDCDTIMIKTSIISHILMYSLFLFIILSAIFSNVVLGNTWLYITIAVILLLLNFIVDQYRLEVIDKAEWK